MAETVEYVVVANAGSPAAGQINQNPSVNLTPNSAPPLGAWRNDAWLLAALFGISALILAPRYQDKLYPDTISYISIAQKYLAGDIANAVNSYWAPLLSWAMVPFIRLGFDPLLAIKLVTIGAGMLTIIAAGRLFRSFAMSRVTMRLALVALLPPMLYFSLSMPTPDLLLTAALTAYLSIVFRDDYPHRWAWGGLCGALGGVAYLSKHYALPFFVVHFLLMNVWHYRRHRMGRTLALSAAAGLLACAALAVPWIAAISARFGDFTIGTSGARTYAYVGPASRGDTLGPHGLVAPPNATAVSAWEDPTVDMLERWSPFESREHVIHQAALVRRHLRATALALLSFSPLSPAILLAYPVLCVWLRRVPKADLPVFTMALYAAGYLWVFIEVRYLWPLCILLLLMTGLVLDAAPSHRRLGPYGKRALGGVLLASFAIVPAVNLARDFDSGADLRELGGLLRQRYGVAGSIAAHSQYREPLYLTYHLGGRFFGTSDRSLPEDRIEAALLAHRIDYYLVPVDDTNEVSVPRFLNRYSEITHGQLPGLQVYRIGAR